MAPSIGHRRRSTRAASAIVAPAASNDTATNTKRRRRRRYAGADPWTSRRKVVKKTNPRPQAPPPTHYTCRICVEEQTMDSFVKWIPPTRRSAIRPTREVPGSCIDHLCRNPRLKNDPVCKTCIGSAMAAKMELTGARTVGTGCLEQGCQTHWDWDTIMEFLPSSALEDYNHGMLPVWKESAHMQTCVSPSCEFVGVIDPRTPGFPHVECPACSLRMCAKCDIPWHDATSCEERAAKRLEEEMTTPEKETLKLMETKNAKRCPNCYLVIEKDGGCDSMRCVGCSMYFNWALAASVAPGAKPYPMPQGLPGSMPVVCEMDRLKTAADRAAAATAV
ncbi:hypothetical protein K504DRAFT_457072 [Pleomassaria siparia CBS 279.74]|uniref:RBR-type E3 ubiquitin transferase n=1 Tax=Pleomassaria siparia CBS 279.74 TaxID=1314801 RepID=A0A6G1KPQ9_9PLEO|nr:hypothetical protein K504DRAFT_457072 [Pleomassaria siparia CBS 279.74]